MRTAYRSLRSLRAFGRPASWIAGVMLLSGLGGGCGSEVAPGTAKPEDGPPGSETPAPGGGDGDVAGVLAAVTGADTTVVVGVNGATIAGATDGASRWFQDGMGDGRAG